MTKSLAALLLLLTACGVGSTDDDDDLETDIAEEATDSATSLASSRPYSAAGDPSPSSDFNKNGKHNDQCVRLKGITTLRYADGKPTGYTLDPAKLEYNPDRRPEDDSSGKPCADGYAQLDTQEIITQSINGTPTRLLFHRGGFPYSPAGNIKYGHIAIGDTVDHADVGKTQGNGIECTASQNSATKGDYKIKPLTIPAAMSFRKSNYASCAQKAGSDATKLKACTNGYESYGDPGYDQGAFADADRHHYTYLLWNFTNVQGGGVVRALMPTDAPFHRCNVKAIKQIAYTDDGKKELGWVKAVYGKTLVGGVWLYGWVVHSHACNGTAAQCNGHVGVTPHVAAL